MDCSAWRRKIRRIRTTTRGTITRTKFYINWFPACRTNPNVWNKAFLLSLWLLSKHGLWILSPPGEGRAIAQAVKQKIPTAAARVLSQVNLCGICSGQSDTCGAFLRVLQFLLPILSPPNTPHSSINCGRYDRPISDRCTKWIRSHPTPRNSKKKSPGFSPSFLPLNKVFSL
jgi:hypothetical protein